MLAVAGEAAAGLRVHPLHFDREAVDGEAGAFRQVDAAAVDAAGVGRERQRLVVAQVINLGDIAVPNARAEIELLQRSGQPPPHRWLQYCQVPVARFLLTSATCSLASLNEA